MTTETPLTKEYFESTILPTLITTIVSRVETTLLPPLLSRLDAIEQTIGEMKKDITELKQFQKYDSNTIEYELQMLLKKHIKHKYPHMSLKDFPMKIIKNPQEVVITELDAAFLIEPKQLHTNYTRLKEAGIHHLPTLKLNTTYDEPTIFIMAEAKHHINRAKVIEKLKQFEQVYTLFKYARDIQNNMPQIYTPYFLKTIQRNKYIANITQWELYFGAANWDKGLLQDLQKDVELRKKLHAKFKVSLEKDKLPIYKRIISIDTKWGIDETMDSPLEYVKIIVPSGERYKVQESNEMNDYMLIGGKTRKHKP